MSTAEMSSKNDIASVLADAQWLPLHLNPAGVELQLAFVPREMHARVPFLTAQDLRDHAPRVRSVPLAEVDRHLGAGTAAPHFIFHSAFCCSTLLTRVLDIPGVSMGLSEPQILNETAFLMRQKRLGEPLLRSVLALLSRPFGPGERLVVKPTNEANLLIEPLLRLDERSHAILLYAPLPRFLRSVARKGMWGRIWARRLFKSVRQDQPLPLGFSEPELFEQTDLQVAALAWLLHQAQFAAVLARFPGRVRHLDSTSFLSDRLGSLGAISAHFGLQMDDARRAEVAQSGVFDRHSKEIGRTFSGDGSAAERELPLVDQEIEMVGSWLTKVAAHVGVPLELPRGSALQPA